MKKNKKIANFNSFFYFERKLLEDYINDQAKKGYHLKVNNYKHVFEYNPDKHVYYYVDAIKTKKRYTGQVKPDEQYLELFEEQGYHFIGKIFHFNIFESENEESIFGDEAEEDIVKDIFKCEFKVVVPSLIFNVFMIGLVMAVFLKGYAGPAYMILSKEVLLFALAFIVNMIGSFYCQYMPLIRYKMTRKLDYTYQDVLKRQFVYQSYNFLFLFFMLSVILFIKIRLILVISVMFIVMTLICIKLFDKFIIDRIENIGNVYLMLTAVLILVFNHNNKAFVLNHEQIKYKEYSQRSSIMEFSWYTLKDSEDCLYLLDIYEPLLTDYIFNDFIGDNEYKQDGDTYFVRDYVVVRKENRILKMEKDFYENHLNSLQW